MSALNRRGLVAAAAALLDLLEYAPVTRAHVSEGSRYASRVAR